MPPLTLDPQVQAQIGPLVTLSKRYGVVDETRNTILAVGEAMQPGVMFVAELRLAQPPLIESFRKELAREFKALGVIVRKAADAVGGVLLESKRSRDARVRAIIEAANLEEWEQEKLKPIYDYQYNKIAKATFQLLKKLGIEDLTYREKIAERILKTGGRRLGLLDIKGDTKKALFDVIEEGRLKGLNPRRVGRLIEQYVPRGPYVKAGSRYRSELIARTETLHAQRISTIEAYKSTNYIKEVVALDGDSDEECAARNGETFTFDEAEVEADNTHPNCVLAFAPYGT